MKSSLSRSIVIFSIYIFEKQVLYFTGKRTSLMLGIFIYIFNLIICMSRELRRSCSKSKSPSNAQKAVERILTKTVEHLNQSSVSKNEEINYSSFSLIP